MHSLPFSSSSAMFFGITGLLLVLPFTATDVTVAASAANPLLTGNWSLAAQRFSPREKHHMVAFPNSTVVMVGGRAHAGKLADFWTGNLDGPTSGWSWTESYLGTGGITGREAMSLHYVNQAFYLFGGRTDDVDGVEDLWTIRDQRWRQVTGGTTADWPLGRYRHQGITLASEDAFLVMFGTSEDRGFNDVWQFNATTSSWTQLHSGVSDGAVPAPRFDPCCQLRTTTNSVICFGGTLAKGDTDEVWEFLLDSNTWVQRATSSAPGGSGAPSKRRLAVCSLVNPNVFVVWAGYSSNDSDNAPAEHTHALNLVNNTWTAIQQPSVLSGALAPRDGAFMNPQPTDAGDVFLYGGLDNASSPLNDVWRLDPMTYIFSPEQAALTAPDGRAEHSTVVIGSSMIVLFGLGTAGLQQDVWAFEVDSGEWTMLSSECPFGARRGAAAVARGNSILVVGGVLEDGNPTSELLAFNVATRAWRRVPSVNAPEGRHRHSATLVDSTKLLILGGTTLSSEQTRDMYLYDPSTSHWYPVTEVPSAGDQKMLPARRSFGMVHHPTRPGSFFVVGGKGSTVLMDRWELSLNTTDSTNPTMVSTELISTIGDVGEVERQYIRSEAAIIGAGRHYVICGGSISSSFPVPEESACYQYDSVLGTNTQMRDQSAPVTAYFSSAVYIKHSMYIFGGNLIQNAIKRTKTYLNLVQRLEFDTPCTEAASDATTLTDDADCIHCAAGSISSIDPTNTGSTTTGSNVSCELTPGGHYTAASIPSSTGSATTTTYIVEVLSCDKGRYSQIEGAHDALFCLPCPEGTFSNETGATSCHACPQGFSCPVGASLPLAVSEETATTEIESQPPAFHTEGISVWSISTVISAWAVAIVLVFVIAWMEKRRYAALADYYLPTESDAALHFIYLNRLTDETGDGESRGLSGVELLNALSDVAELLYHWTPAEMEAKLTEETVDDLIEYFEDSGLRHLRYREFRLVLCMLFEHNYFAALPDTPFHASGGKVRPVQRSFLELEDLDMFATQHTFWNVGEPVNTQNTQAGGITTLIGITGILAVGALLVLLFVLDNLDETSSSLPRVAIPGLKVTDVNANMTIDVITLGQDNRDLCIQPGTSRACVSGSSVTLSAGVVSQHNETTTTECSFVSPGYCTMHWACQSCSFLNHSNTVGFLFGHPDWYSTETVVSTSVDSAVRDEFGTTTDGISVPSAVIQVLKPATAGTVMKGYPASTLVLEGTPTVFSAPRSVLDLRQLTSYGYHITTSETTHGNEPEVAELPTHVGVPIEVTFEISTNYLSIKRFLKKDVVSVVASLLGVMSGLMAVCGFFLSCYDRLFKWDRHPSSAADPNFNLMDDISENSTNCLDGQFSLDVLEESRRRSLARGQSFKMASFATFNKARNGKDPLAVALGQRKRKVADEEADNLVKVCQFRRPQAKAIIDAISKIAAAAAAAAGAKGNAGGVGASDVFGGSSVLMANPRSAGTPANSMPRQNSTQDDIMSANSTLMGDFLPLTTAAGSRRANGSMASSDAGSEYDYSSGDKSVSGESGTENCSSNPMSARVVAAHR